jgi:CheY-like chemotaxis protein
VACRILFVDDYVDALTVWSLYLQTCGFEVLSAESGLRAVRIAHQSHPALAIVDLDLPDLSGCEVAEHLRHELDTASMPLIAVTGHSEPARVDQARRAGFDVVLTKPCEPSVLLGHIHRLVPTAPAQALGH